MKYEIDVFQPLSTLRSSRRCSTRSLRSSTPSRTRPGSTTPAKEPWKDREDNLCHRQGKINGKGSERWKSDLSTFWSSLKKLSTFWPFDVLIFDVPTPSQINVTLCHVLVNASIQFLLVFLIFYSFGEIVFIYF